MSEYPAPVLAAARRLHLGGWTLRDVQAHVERETGQRPSLQTISRWVSPEQAAKHQARGLRRHRSHSARGGLSGGRLGSHRHTREWQEHRIRMLLTDAGMTVANVARVMAFDFPGEGWTRRRVDRLAHQLRNEGAPAGATTTTGRTAR